MNLQKSRVNECINNIAATTGTTGPTTGTTMLLTGTAFPLNSSQFYTCIMYVILLHCFPTVCLLSLHITVQSYFIKPVYILYIAKHCRASKISKFESCKNISYFTLILKLIFHVLTMSLKR